MRTVPQGDPFAVAARGVSASVDGERGGPYGGAMTRSTSADGAASGAAGGVSFPASYDLLWTALIAVLILAFAWTLVTVLRSSLSGRAKAVWVVLAIVIPVVTGIAWFVLGADARKPSSSHP